LPEEKEEEEDWDNLEEDKPESDVKDASASNPDWEKQALAAHNAKMAKTQVKRPLSQYL
jgi:hypothetical protein